MFNKLSDAEKKEVCYSGLTKRLFSILAVYQVFPNILDFIADFGNLFADTFVIPLVARLDFPPHGPYGGDQRPAD
jgi:hypothetical protein